MRWKEIAAIFTSHNNDVMRHQPVAICTGEDDIHRQQSGNQPVVRSGSVSAEAAAKRAWTNDKERLSLSFSRSASFSDPGLCSEMQEVKSNIRKHLSKGKPKPYNVHDHYYTTGCFQAVARHAVFEYVTMVVIGLNAVYMAVDTDYNKNAQGRPGGPTDSQPIFVVLSNFFCSYFLLELFIRFGAFENKLNTLRDAWFVVDTILLLLMITETWIMLIVAAATGTAGKAPLGQTAVLRMFRLLRLSRIVRMLRSFPELMVLVTGMIAAMRTVLYMLSLMLMGNFVFAIAFTQLSSTYEYGIEYFSSVPESMYHLLMQGTFMDNLGDWFQAILEESPFCLFLALVFVGFANLTILNLLTGVLTQVIDEEAKKQQEVRLTNMVSDRMQQCVQSIDTNSDNKISPHEFRQILENDQAVMSLKEVGVDPERIVEFADEFFCGEDGQPEPLDFEDFMDKVWELRDTNAATLKDAKALWSWIDPKLKRTRKSIQEVRVKMEEDTSRLETKIVLLLDEIQLLEEKLISPKLLQPGRPQTTI